MHRRDMEPERFIRDGRLRHTPILVLSVVQGRVQFLRQQVDHYHYVVEWSPHLRWGQEDNSGETDFPHPIRCLLRSPEQGRLSMVETLPSSSQSPGNAPYTKRRLSTHLVAHDCKERPKLLRPALGRLSHHIELIVPLPPPHLVP